MTDNANITVVFADKTFRSYYVEPRKTVISFRKMVADSISIEDDKYFGFYIQDDVKNIYWLSDEKIVYHYDFMKYNNPKLILYFAFKYFYQFDYWLADNVTKQLCYYQLKKQLYDGDFDCDTDRCFKLLAMTLLLDDDHSKSSFQDIKKLNIIPPNLFARHPSIDYCVEEIMIKYKEFEPISKDELMKRFIVYILEIPFQLTHFFFAKSFSSTVVIAINQNGFFESEKCNKSISKLEYKWSEITNISYNKSRISIDIQDPTHRSSIRRKSTALSISYELSNQNLAKSFIYLAKDIVNYISQRFECMRVMSTTTPRRNPNNIKKNLSNTYSGNKERIRPSTQNAFIPENDIAISRSSSKISLASSNYAGSAITNDSTSLQLDEDLPINIPEKQKIFLELNGRRKIILDELNNKIKEAVQNCISESNITKTMPPDLKKLDPKGQIKLTKFSLRTQCITGDASSFQSKKNAILGEIETLQNIVGKLKEHEKKHRIEIKKKEEQIQNCIRKMKDLEESNAFEAHMNTSRSNSEGCLYPIPNGNVPEIYNGCGNKFNDNSGPLTEPRSRRHQNIINDCSSSGSETLKLCKNQYSRMKSTDSSSSTSKSASSLRPSDIKNFNSNSNPSPFHRFASNRSQIRGQQSKFHITFNRKKSFETNSNSSVDSSNSSVDVPDAPISRSSNSNSDTEHPEDQIISIRANHMNNLTNNTVRDSREINIIRGKLTHKISNMKIMSRSKTSQNHNPNRKSVSLEELREDGSDISEAPSNFSITCRKESSGFRVTLNSKLTYHPSKKDGRPINLTRGKQPSITRKAAKPTIQR